MPRTFNDVVAPTLKVFCLCCLPNDGHFMICCDPALTAMTGIMVSYCVGIRPDLDIGNNGKEMKGDNKLGIYLSQLHFRYYLGEFCYCGPTCLILLLIHVNLVRIFRVGR